MAKIRWTEQALDDVEGIAAYISRDSNYYAQMFTRKIFESIERLKSLPESGRVVPEIGQSTIREIILGNYRIIYRVEFKKDKIEILTVYHSARLLNNDSIKF